MVVTIDFIAGTRIMWCDTILVTIDYGLQCTSMITI